MGNEKVVENRIVDLHGKLIRRDWSVGKRVGSPTSITIHYNGPATKLNQDRQAIAFMYGVSQYHTKPGWGGTENGADGILYHYSIGPEGTIYQMRYDDEILWHAGVKEANEHSLAIFIPIGENQRLQEAQKSALYYLLMTLTKKYNIPTEAIFPHGHWHRTACPGRFLRAFIDEYKAHTIIITPSDNIFRMTGVTEEQCVSYIMSRPHGAYEEYKSDDIDIKKIVSAYFHACLLTGIDPLWIIAQMIHETGNLTSFWSDKIRKNPAGIGVNGITTTKEPANTAAWQFDGKKWRIGIAFNNWETESVPAHVGRVLAYSLKDSEATEIQKDFITKALSYRTLPHYIRGCAKTFNNFNGTWAVPGDFYATAICAIANKIISS